MTELKRVREIQEDKEEDQSEVSEAADNMVTSAVEAELDPMVKREENLEKEEDLLEVVLPTEAQEKLWLPPKELNKSKRL